MPKPPALKTEAFVKWFRSATPYIHQWGGSTFVIAFGGEVLADGEFQQLTHDINVLVSLEVRVVLVHGARPQIEEQMRQHGVKPRYVGSRRVTDDKALACVKEANGIVRVEMEALLSMELANSPMWGADIRVSSGNFVTAKPVGVVEGVDFGHTGEVRKIDAEGIRRRLDDHEVVLISPVGFSPTGDVFNCTVEDVATATAIALRADKLIFLTETAGAPDRKGKLIAELTVKQAQELVLENGKLPEDVRVYLPCAVKACAHGVKRAHLISRHVDGALLIELFTHHGIGTMVVPESPEVIRDATADDVAGIVQIIEPLEQQGILVKRDRGQLDREIERFYVIAASARVSIQRRAGLNSMQSKAVSAPSSRTRLPRCRSPCPSRTWPPAWRCAHHRCSPANAGRSACNRGASASSSKVARVLNTSSIACCTRAALPHALPAAATGQAA